MIPRQTCAIVEAGSGEHDHVTAAYVLPGENFIVYACQKLSTGENRLCVYSETDQRASAPVQVCYNKKKTFGVVHGLHNDWVHTITSSPDGIYIGSIGHDKVVRLSVNTLNADNASPFGAYKYGENYSSVVFFPGIPELIVLSVDTGVASTSKMIVKSWTPMPQPPWAFHSFWNTNCRVRSLSVSQCGLLLAMTYENNGMSMVWWCDTSRLTIKHLCDISCLEGCAHPTQPLIAAEQEAHNVAVFRVKPDSTVLLCQNRHLNRGKGSVCSMAWDKKNGNRLLVVSQHSLVVFHYITYPEDKHELLPVYEYMSGRTGLPFRFGGCGFWRRDSVFFIQEKKSRKQCLTIHQLPNGSCRREYARVFLWASMRKVSFSPAKATEVKTTTSSMDLPNFFAHNPGLCVFVGKILLRYIMDRLH